MPNKTAIEWTDYTSNPIKPVGGGWGCSKVSPGCDHCYAETLNLRLGNHRPFNGKWEFELNTEEIAALKKLPAGQRIFMCDMTDMFHNDVPWDMIHSLFATMRVMPRQTFQILTKRPGRMLYWARLMDSYGLSWPSNVWAGVSVESAKYLPRLDLLAMIAARIRFVSAEPLLSVLDISRWLGYNPVHEEQEYRNICLSCGYQWRARNRRSGVHLASGKEDLGSVESLRTSEQVQKGQGRERYRGILSSQSDVREDSIRSLSSPSRLDALFRSDTSRINYQSQERAKEGQSPGELGIGDLQGPTTPRVAHSQSGTDRSTWREERNGQAERCPSCGDSSTAVRRGNLALDSEGLWCELATNLKDCIASAPIISWVICGGESGPKARPMDPSWVRQIRDDCQAAGVPYFFKQWGEWHPTMTEEPVGNWKPVTAKEATQRIHLWPDGDLSIKIGRKAAGALLGGREWREFPAA